MSAKSPALVERPAVGLTEQFGDGEREYLTMDDDTVLDAARNDPAGFIRGFDLVTIDETQRAPKPLGAIKRSVDSDRTAGRFLLTGSANISLSRKSPRRESH